MCITKVCIPRFIDVDDLYFDDKQIEKNDTPKKLGILNGDYINVFNTLVD